MGNSSDKDLSTTGSAVVSENNTPDNVSKNDQPPSGIPYIYRRKCIMEIEHSLEKGNMQAALDYLQQLRKTLGIETNESAGKADLYFILDESGVDEVLKLTQVLKSQPKDWQHAAELICHRLLRHFGPPVKTASTMPESKSRGLVKLSLIKKILTNKKRIKSVAKIIEHNQDLKSVELAFTGLDDKGFNILLPSLSVLPGLTYLGLRGNCLTEAILGQLEEVLGDEELFPRLMWIDIKNNVDIYMLPVSLLKSLQSRWPAEGHKPTFRELADGQAIVTDDIMDINV